MTKPKILFWDIETSLMSVKTFGLNAEYVSHKRIVTDWQILCTAYKWAGEKAIHCPDSLQKDRFGYGYSFNDYELCKHMREVLIEADIIVHHNGNDFDIKKFNSRLIAHGLNPLPTTLTCVDTYKAVKQIAKFTCHRLDYLGKKLGLGGKDGVDSDLWDRLFDDPNLKDMAKMVKYCKQDVRLLEKLFNYLKAYIKIPLLNPVPTSNLDLTAACCPNCHKKGSLIHRGIHSTLLKRYRRLSCTNKKCLKWTDERRI